MPGEQMHLDFSIPERAPEEPCRIPAKVFDLNVVRQDRSQEQLFGVYQRIVESVKHVRLSRPNPDEPRHPSKTL